uniref:G protein-coupled receptor n=1 Tax=Globodera pallida TaxID=36090 RepID=A0A183CGG3_GLOPA
MSSASNRTLAFGGYDFLLFTGGATELVINLVGMPLSLVNLWLVSRTSVIHPNMKFILIFQSCFILTRGSCRFIICLFKFLLWDPIGAEMTAYLPAIRLAYYIGIYGRNFVPHILIVERVLATLTVKSYERNRRCLFSLLWSPMAATLAVLNALSAISDGEQMPLTNLITTIAQFVIGTAEFAVFALLWRYNANIYQKMLQKAEAHCLSERYQLSENIRIGRQLMPPLLLNLANILLGMIILLWNCVDLPYYWIMFTFCSNFNSFFGLLIELFIITCHPFLMRDFSVVGLAQRDLISGRALIERSKPDDHFAILRNAWERPCN